MEIEHHATDSLMTPGQASSFLQVPESTLAAWRSTNRVKLPFIKVGHAVRYVRADLVQMIQDRRHEAL